jgi:nitrate/TMAO reductase-like tetraheme cytochrome c subunit
MRRLCGPLLLMSAVVAVSWPAVGQPVVTGLVRDEQGPVAGARVRFQGEGSAALTDRAGRFSLPAGKARRLTAWKEGYVIAAVPADRRPLCLTLARLPAEDHEDYSWIDPTPDAKRPAACGNCHRAIYEEWAGSAHSRAASNKHVLNLIQGRDWRGRPSRTWSLADEYPLGAAVCAACHAPTLRDPTLAYDLATARGADAKGVHCDYCHKIVEAPTDRLGTRFGRDGLRLLRPADQELLFFGPLDDAYRPGEAFAYSPLYKDSRYCASCHEGIVFGVRAYGTYSEWLDSPAKKQGRHCQDCHMAPTGTLPNLAPGKGGIERDPRTLASHALAGGAGRMLRGCLSLSLTVRATGLVPAVQAEVVVCAKDVGHRVPTGFLDRNLILVVEGRDAAGKVVALQEGPKLPPAAGKALAGQPGYLYAKLLLGSEGKGPVPFWGEHGELKDTRLMPGRPDRRTFLFPPQTRRIRAVLLYRRFWQDVADRKGWPDNEITVAERSAEIPPPSTLRGRK